MFIASLLGSIVIIWSLLKIREPSLLLGGHDGVARFLFSSRMVGTLLHADAPVFFALHGRNDQRQGTTLFCMSFSCEVFPTERNFT